MFDRAMPYLADGNDSNEMVRLAQGWIEKNPKDPDATVFLGRCLKEEGPRAGDPRSEGRERIKTNYEETAYRELKAELESKK